MTETPDDMDGVVSEWLANDLTSATQNGNVFAFVRVDHLRALLLNYQERGRALEELLASTVGPEGETILFLTLKDLIREQSEGEWDEKTIENDARIFTARILAALGTTATDTGRE
jgi:hypothetical protein